MTVEQLLADFKEYSQHLRDLRKHRDYRDMNCVILCQKGDGVIRPIYTHTECLRSHFELFRPELRRANYLIFLRNDQEIAIIPANRQIRITELSAAERLIDPYVTDLTRAVVQIPAKVRQELGLTENDTKNWWRVIFRLAWKHPRALLRTTRQQILVPHDRIVLHNRIPIFKDEGSIQFDANGLYQENNLTYQELFPNAIYSELRYDICEMSVAAINVIIEALQRQKTAEGGPPKNDRNKRVTADEAEILVRVYLSEHAPNDPDAITRDGIAQETGVSKGQVSNTNSWKVFRERRKADKKTKPREIPLTDKMSDSSSYGAYEEERKANRMQAAIPNDEYADSDELDALIQEQQDDEAEQERRHKRRHDPS